MTRKPAWAAVMIGLVISACATVASDRELAPYFEPNQPANSGTVDWASQAPDYNLELASVDQLGISAASPYKRSDRIHLAAGPHHLVFKIWQVKGNLKLSFGQTEAGLGGSISYTDLNFDLSAGETKHLTLRLENDRPQLTWQTP